MTAILKDYKDRLNSVEKSIRISYKLEAQHIKHSWD
jgi:hypothetical protein